MEYASDSASGSNEIWQEQEQDSGEDGMNTWVRLPNWYTIPQMLHFLEGAKAIAINRIMYIKSETQIDYEIESTQLEEVSK